ncbi:GGDEF domain-containing protein [Cellulomonas carbonis]|uniref:Diguanylate cyclase n=1 Tax=Cellulomonas carbonis T26 TaxID=947969 RepID=A0A0A0BW45_9CELL|nr:GGDEF domain-containing protein [Cellulomonas carbonis]KGM11379.1 diguanylate cyclase [Cellulomonas carbonis T26]GGC00717.1 hypothetical protein GCM10010972_11850 [Cellulomonas carbonis]
MARLRPGQVRPDLPLGPALLVLVLVSAGTAVLMRYLADRGLVLGNPVVLTALVIVASVIGYDVGRYPVASLDRGRPAARGVRIGLRLTVVLALCAAFAWFAGWSLVLPGMVALASVAHVEAAGSRMWRPAVAAGAALTVAGQVGVQLGWLPSIVVPDRSHVAALWIALPTGVAIAYVGRSVAQREELARAQLSAEARLNALLNSSSDVVVVVDASGVMTYVSPPATAAFGTRPEALVGRPVTSLVDAEHGDAVLARLQEVVRAGGGAREAFDVLMEVRRARRWHEWTVLNMLDDPLVGGLVVDMRDISDRLHHQQQLAHAAAHDPLTGLPNRAELMRVLTDELAEAAPGAGVAVLFMDLDLFKEVNDTHGHAAGDELLVAVAGRLRAALRPHDHVARMGGDEFCVVLTEVRDDKEVETVVGRLRRTVREPIHVAGVDVTVGVSIGAATTTDPTTPPTELFADADAAMYRVKHRR